MRRLLRTGIVIIIMLLVLYIGGYSWDSFTRTLEVKDPSRVFATLARRLPDLSSDDATMPSFGNSDSTEFTFETEDPDLQIGPDTYPTEEINENGLIPAGRIDISYTRILSVGINGQTIDLSTTTSVSFIKWLAANYSAGAEFTYTGEDGEVIDQNATTETEPLIPTPSVAETEDTTETSETTDDSTETTETTQVTPVPTVNPVLVDVADEVTYDDILQDSAHMYALVEDIEVVEELPDYNALVESGDWEAYNRNTFETPVQNYLLGGIRLNRNNYSWMSGHFFNQDDFTFTCPYTGTIITDMDDGKDDDDFGNLDYDHIVPLKSTYIRGAYAWTEEQRNEYAYDQWIGVDVLNSANRSKSDKGPLDYLPTENIEDYCYSWLLICSKYDLVMTEDEIALCEHYILEALSNGEPVEHLGGHYEI